MAVFLILLTLSGLIGVIAGSILNFHYLIITEFCLLIVAGVIFALNRHAVLDIADGSCICRRNNSLQSEATESNIRYNITRDDHEKGSEERERLL